MAAERSALGHAHAASGFFPHTLPLAFGEVPVHRLLGSRFALLRVVMK
jgi:hypothetical protein